MAFGGPGQAGGAARPMTPTRALVLSCSALALLGAAAPAAAQTGAENGTGIYVHGFGGYHLQRDMEFQDTAGKLNIEFEGNYAIGAAVGYKFSRTMSVEGEISYRTAKAEKVTFAGAAQTGKPEVKSTAFMVNGIAQLGRGTFKPYLGLGLGVATLEIERFTGTTFTFLGGDTTELAYQLIAGVAYEVMPKVQLTLDYRYFATAAPEATKSGGGTGEIDPFASHAFLVGVRYNF